MVFGETPEKRMVSVAGSLLRSTAPAHQFDLIDAHHLLSLLSLIHVIPPT
jgi:hypothetical protein